MTTHPDHNQVFIRDTFEMISPKKRLFSILRAPISLAKISRLLLSTRHKKTRIQLDYRNLK